MKIVSKSLKEAIRIVSQLSDVYTFLSIHEKAIVYKYTDDGYEDINEILRYSNGEKISELGKYLKEVLNKIPSQVDIAYRGVYLSQSKINFYVNAFNQELTITEHSFISASTKDLVAWQFGTTRFKIFSENWKNISPISKHISENEVILNCNSMFNVVGYNFENGIHEFTMIEV